MEPPTMARTEGLWMKVYERALDEPRIKRIARRAGLSEFDVFGRIARLWLQCYRGLSEFVDRMDAEIVTGELHGFIDLVIEERLADAVDLNTIRVRGAEDALVSLRNAADIAQANSAKGRKSGERRRQMSEELQKRTAVQLGFEQGFNDVSTTALNSGSTVVRTAVELQDLGSGETRSDQNQSSSLLSGSPSSSDKGAPPPLENEPGANEGGFQPRKVAPPEAVKLATLLLQLVTSNNPGSRLAHGNRRLHNVTITRWADQIRKLHQTDHMSWQVIEGMIRWCQSDTFWRTIILGAENLRERWDSMAAQQNRRPSSSGERSKNRPGPTELAMREAEELRAASKERP